MARSKNRVSETKFVVNYVKACKLKKTRQEFADMIGMPLASANSRISAYKSKVTNPDLPESERIDEKDFPLLVDAGERASKKTQKQSVAELLRALSSDVDELNEEAFADDSIEDEDEEIDAEAEEEVNA